MQGPLQFDKQKKTFFFHIITSGIDKEQTNHGRNMGISALTFFFLHACANNSKVPYKYTNRLVLSLYVEEIMCKKKV